MLMTVPILGAVAVLLAVATVVLIRAIPWRAGKTAEERAELAIAPMPGLQRRAWWALLIGVAASATITTILAREGAAAYWNDDDLRSTVVTIFLGGLLGYVAVLLIPVAIQEATGALDERDQLILSRAPNIQPAACLLALAAWLVALPRMYRAEGAVPMVYLYLIFGSVILANIVGHAAGVLMGYWLAERHGQG